MKGEIGPFGLRLEPAIERMEVGARERFLGDDPAASAHLDLG